MTAAGHARPRPVRRVLPPANCLDRLDTALQPPLIPKVLVGSGLHGRSAMTAGRMVAAGQTERALRLVREVLGQDVLGAYQHGSAVLGGVQPTSDIDILVVTGRLATLVEKRRIDRAIRPYRLRFPLLAWSAVSS